MTKPWEENWEHDEGFVVARVDAKFAGINGKFQHNGQLKGDPEERARLAAAAPDLARALMGLKDGFLSDAIESCWCGPNALDTHSDACLAARAALEKAGVL